MYFFWIYTMFQPTEKHPATRILEDNWQDILAE
jgi:hypothetical protein